MNGDVFIVFYFARGYKNNHYGCFIRRHTFRYDALLYGSPEEQGKVEALSLARSEGLQVASTSVVSATSYIAAKNSQPQITPSKLQYSDRRFIYPL